MRLLANALLDLGIANLFGACGGCAGSCGGFLLGYTSDSCYSTSGLTTL
jgi:hypothetical protein